MDEEYLELVLDLVAAVPGVEAVHHVHAWSLTPDRPMLTLHARIADLGDSERITQAIGARLRERFGVDHVTVQIERAHGAMEGCSRTD